MNNPEITIGGIYSVNVWISERDVSVAYLNILLNRALSGRKTILISNLYWEKIKNVKQCEF